MINGYAITATAPFLRIKTELMEAMIFAAGLGTRLGPYTAHTPKALVRLQGKPLLLHTIERLQAYGINHIVINIHHFAEQLREYIEQKDWGETKILLSDESEQLLNTGGGLLHAAPLFSGREPIFACNVDLMTDIDFHALVQHYETRKPLALLSVRQRKTSRYLLFDPDKQLCGWKNITNHEIKYVEGTNSETDLTPYAFSGMQIISPQLLTTQLPQKACSLIDLYLQLAAEHQIEACLDDSKLWMDLGKIEDFPQ